MTALLIDAVEGKAALSKLRAEWEACMPRSFAATLSTPAWYLAWCAVFPPKEFVLFTAREKGRLVGLLPLARVKTDARGLYFQQVTNFARGDYQPPILASGASAEVLPGLLDAAFEYFGQSLTYWFANIPSTDGSLEILKKHLQLRRLAITETFQTAPRLHIAGRGYKEIESTWPASHRTDVRRQRKRLAALGELKVWQPQTIDEVHATLEEFFLVHDEKWVAEGQASRFHDSSERRHFAAIANNLWGNGLHLSTVRCGAINVSYGFGFHSDGWVQWYRPTYRKEFHNFSPGKVHIALLLERGCEAQWKGIDFLLGEERYKLQWSNERLKVVDIHAAFNPASLGYQWFTRGKPYVRDRLGPLYRRTLSRVQRGLRLRRQDGS